MAAEADAQPAVGVEGARRLHRPADDRGQRAAHLRRRDALGQRVPQRHLRQQLERAEPVGERAADRREGAVRRDQPFQDRGVAPARAGRTRVASSFQAGISSRQTSSTSSSIGWMTKLL